MPVELEKKDLAKYPFLQEAHDMVSVGAYAPLDTFLKSNAGTFTTAKAVRRIQDAVNPPYRFENLLTEKPENEVLAYAIARLIISCADDVRLADRLAQYESERALYFFRDEESAKIQQYVADSVGFPAETSSLPMISYVNLTAKLRDASWRLVNRRVYAGEVQISSEETNELLLERIRILLRRGLPIAVPDGLCEQLSGATESITKIWQERILQQFGSVEEGAFPPCMQAIIHAVAAGTNIPHAARFAVTAFMNTIGMDETQIVEVYTRAPDFDISRTMYQVEHISGRSGTEYTPPSCPTMKTYGLCVNKNALCAKVQHPLSYYTRKKKELNKKNEEKKNESGDSFGSENNGTAHGHKEHKNHKSG